MLASELYPDYPDPMPAFQFLGGDYGRSLLESALAQPLQQFGGRYLYRTIYDKASALFLSLIKNHPLLDGNKRLSLTTVTVFLLLNGTIFYAPRADAVNFALRIAQGDLEVNQREISRWLRRRSISIWILRDMRQDELANFLAQLAESNLDNFLDWLGRPAGIAGSLTQILNRMRSLSPDTLSEYFIVG